MMTVKQLREELEGWDDDTVVTVRYDSPGGWVVIAAPVSELYEGDESRAVPFIVLRAP